MKKLTEDSVKNFTGKGTMTLPSGFNQRMNMVLQFSAQYVGEWKDGELFEVK